MDYQADLAIMAAIPLHVDTWLEISLQHRLHNHGHASHGRVSRKAVQEEEATVHMVLRLLY